MSFNPDPFANTPRPETGGDPFAPAPTGGFDPTADPFALEGSYIHAAASDNRHYNPTVTGLGIFSAPWALMVAGLCYTGIAGTFIYRMVAHIKAGNNLNDVLFFIAVIAIILLIGFSFATLKAKEWGRIALSIMSGVGVFLVVVDGMWPITLVGIIAAALLWLPGNKHWFGY